MAPASLYCVQPVTDAAGRIYDPGRTVEAPSPFEAARLVLGDNICLDGTKSEICARVVRLDQQYRTVTTTIYTRGSAVRDMR